MVDLGAQGGVVPLDAGRKQFITSGLGKRQQARVLALQLGDASVELLSAPAAARRDSRTYTSIASNSSRFLWRDRNAAARFFTRRASRCSG